MELNLEKYDFKVQGQIPWFHAHQQGDQGQPRKILNHIGHT